MIISSSKKVIGQTVKTRMIYTNFWKDNYISSLSSKEKLAFIYLLTNDAVNICGMYQLPDKFVCMELDLASKDWENIKTKFIKEGKFYFKNGWVKILNYEKYNNYVGEKNKTARDRELALIPSNIIEYRYSIDRVSGTLDTLNNKLIINNRDRESVREKETPIQAYIKTFNSSFSSNYEVTDGRTAKLKTRLKRYTLDQILQATRNLSRSKWHRGEDPKSNGWKASPDFLLDSDEKIDLWLHKYEKTVPKEDKLLQLARQQGISIQS